jgi:hypothetical protein
MQKSMLHRLLAAGAGRAVRCCPKISVRAHNIDRWRCGGRGWHSSRGVVYVHLLCFFLNINITKDDFADS